MRKTVVLDIVSTSNRKILDFTRLGFRDILLLGKYNYLRMRPPLKPNMLINILQICYCGKGEQVYELDGTRYKIKGGEVLVTFPGEMHSTGNHPEGKGVMYWLIIHLRNRRSGGNFLGVNGSEAKQWKSQLLNLPRRHFKGNATMRNILEHIFREYDQKKDSMKNIRLNHLFKGYLLEVIDCSRKGGVPGFSERLLKLDQLIKGSLDEAVSLDRMASVVELSLSRFKSWFKEETGITPLDYVLRQKIKYAEELLRGNSSIKEIAWDLGFQTPQYFATVFKKYNRVSPTIYRKEIK